MFLLDTVVLSELRKRNRNAGVVAWMTERASADLFVSVVTVGEIERGIARQRERDPAFAIALHEWFDRTLTLWGERILPFDLGAARRWGRLSAELGHDDADVMIAATALERGLTVVTRNVRRFQPTGVATLNPFS